MKEEIAVTPSMVSGFSTDETGSKVLTVRYETYTFTFTNTDQVESIGRSIFTIIGLENLAVHQILSTTSHSLLST